jgi:hypothetical protein
MSDTFRPHVDDYLDESTASPHFSPRLMLELPVLPTLTLHLAQDGQTGLLQRWYDVSADTLDGIGVRSRDFVPDGILRLVDKDGQEIWKASVKLTDEWDGLPYLLARIEKAWEFSGSFDDFWQKARDIMFRTPVPTFEEAAPGLFMVARSRWMEFACFWVAFLATARGESGGQDWQNSLTGDQLIFAFVEFYNNRPERGPRINEPSFVVDCVTLAAHLGQVRSASNNQQKKTTLETLAELMLSGINGFVVQPSVRAGTGELDRFVRNNCINPQIARLGPILLVECKHWNKAAGTDEVGAFIADLQDARLSSGILLSRKGVSREGQNRIFNYYQRGGGFIVELSDEDMELVCNGSNLAQMIIEKMEAITFQRGSRRKTSARTART